jgi:hypothetical protein
MPCQRKLPGNHLARCLDTCTAGALAGAYLAAELVIITR